MTGSATTLRTRAVFFREFIAAGVAWQRHRQVGKAIRVICRLDAGEHEFDGAFFPRHQAMRVGIALEARVRDPRAGSGLALAHKGRESLAVGGDDRDSFGEDFSVGDDGHGFRAEPMKARAKRAFYSAREMPADSLPCRQSVQR